MLSKVSVGFFALYDMLTIYLYGVASGIGATLVAGAILVYVLHP